jgi:hypothetical protein
VLVLRYLLTTSLLNNSDGGQCRVLHEIIERVLHGIEGPALLVPHKSRHPFVPGSPCLYSILNGPKYLFVGANRVSDTSIAAGGAMLGVGWHVVLDLVQAVLEILEFLLETLKSVLKEGRDLG